MLLTPFAHPVRNEEEDAGNHQPGETCKEETATGKDQPKANKYDGKWFKLVHSIKIIIGKLSLS